MEIHLIWAEDKNGGIGCNGKLPWHIPEDLKNFKSITMDSTIIMGRKTWDSLPIRPLPNRNNIILSSKKQTEGITFNSLDNCINYLNEEKIDKVFVIGGRSIYKIFFKFAKYLHISFISKNNQNINEYFPINQSVIKKHFKKIKTQNLCKDATYTLWLKK